MVSGKKSKKTGAKGKSERGKQTNKEIKTQKTELAERETRGEN